MQGAEKQQQQRVKVRRGRRMSQCEWAGARALSRTGGVGVWAGVELLLEAFTEHMGSECHREKTKTTKDLILHKTRKQKTDG